METPGAARLPLLTRARIDARSIARLPFARARRSLAHVYNPIAGRFGLQGVTDNHIGPQWSRVLRRSRRTLKELPPPTGEKVLFSTMFGHGGAMLALESILGMSLRLRGADVHYLECAATLPACEFNRFGNHDPTPTGYAPPFTQRSALDDCKACTWSVDDMHGRLPVPMHRLHDHLRPADLANALAVVDKLDRKEYRDFKHAGVSVGDHAFSSVMRATLRGTLRDDDATWWLFRRYLASTILMTDLVGRCLDDLKPQVLLSHHGVYATQGTVTEVARQRGIRIVVHGIPFRAGTIVASHDDTYHRTLASEPNSAWERMSWTSERSKRIEDYLASRRFGGRDYVSFHRDAIDSQETIRQELELDDRPILSMFTNVLWDAQLYYRHNAFGDMLQWIYATIRYARERPDLQLAIRIHPAEVKGALPTQQPLLPEIEREFPDLPENVVLVRPESRVSSYVLAEMSDAALIYGARMGVEIAAMGTPLVIAGETFNRGKGFSYDAETPEEYFSILDRVPGLARNNETMIERARRYAYHIYFRRMMDFPLFTIRDGFHVSGLKLAFETLDDLRPGRSAALDVLCDGILHATPFVLGMDPAESQAYK